MNSRDVAIAAGALLLLGVGLVRVAVPDRARLRRMSVEGISVPSEPIATGQHIDRDVPWPPPTDVYLLGWSHSIGAPDAEPELYLLAGNTVIFQSVKRTDFSTNPAFLQAGSGFLVRKGEAVTLRLKITNTGPPGMTMGARALVYFVPVEGN